MPALVSSRGQAAGRYVAKPASLGLIPGPSGTKAAHLHWVDWGQPVAFATGDILYQTSAHNFESEPGALVLYGLVACGSRPTYYYQQAEGFSPTGYYKGFAAAGPTPPRASPC